MKIFRHDENCELYVIEFLIKDTRFLNRNARAGVYALPFLHQGKPITYLTQSVEEMDDFVFQFFTEVART